MTWLEFEVTPIGSGTSNKGAQDRSWHGMSWQTGSGPHALLHRPGHKWARSALPVRERYGERLRRATLRWCPR